MGSIQVEEFVNKWFGWDINCCNWYEEETALILVPWFVFVLSFFYQNFVLALKSPRITEKSDLKALILYSNLLKYERKPLTFETILTKRSI